MKRRHKCFSQEDPDGIKSLKYKCCVLHLSNEPFPKDDSDLEDVENDRFLPMFPDFS